MKKLARNISILLIALLLACCLIVGFTACGDDSSSSGSGSGSGSGTEQGSGNEGSGNEGGSTDTYANSYKIEAENMDFADTTIWGTRYYKGYSLNGMSPLLTSSDASNGYCCGNLYTSGAYICFVFECDVATTAKLTLGLSMNYECSDGKSNTVTLTDSQFEVYVNDYWDHVEYGSFDYDMTGLSTQDTHTAFKDYSVGTVDLEVGQNWVVLHINNQIKGQGGTMDAIAPLIDYLTIDTDASVTWTDCTSQIVSANIAGATTLV